jgi:excinuclease ABC subunit B
VAILDADKEGFLRSERSLIQTIGRAARHLNGRAILYADKITDSMQRALDETRRRREKQTAHNLAEGITPRSISKQIREMIDGVVSDKTARDDLKAAQAAAEVEAMSEKDLGKRIKLLEKQMLEHARNLEFEKAARATGRGVAPGLSLPRAGNSCDQSRPNQSGSYILDCVSRNQARVNPMLNLPIRRKSRS